MLNADSNENCKKINSLFSKEKTNKQTNNFSSAAQTVAWASGWTYGHVTIKCIDNQCVLPMLLRESSAINLWLNLRKIYVMSLNDLYHYCSG